MYYCYDIDYGFILINYKWKIKPCVLLDTNSLHAFTCKYHDVGEDKLALFSPTSTNKNIFNSDIPDQLSHCVKIPRIKKPMKPMKYSTNSYMVQFHSSYHGVDTISVTKKMYFSKISKPLSRHKDATIIGREDINCLLHNKVVNNK